MSDTSSHQDDGQILANLTPEQREQYERFLDALLELHAVMVARGKWPAVGVTVDTERASVESRNP